MSLISDEKILNQSDPWNLQPNWKASGAKQLWKLIRIIPEGTKINVVGHASLQILVEPEFPIKSVELVTNLKGLQTIIEQNKLGEGDAEPYLEQKSQHHYLQAQRWQTRAIESGITGLNFIHPMDVIIGNLHHLEEKDLAAIRMLRNKLGRPTEQEMIEELKAALDIYRPSFEGEERPDFRAITNQLWTEIYGHGIDVQNEIIRPAVHGLNEAYARQNEARSLVLAPGQ